MGVRLPPCCVLVSGRCRALWPLPLPAAPCACCQTLRLLLLLTAHPPLPAPLPPAAGEPLLMSAARDNSLKHWVFDGVDGAARLLRFRSGHAAPPTVVRHYGAGRLLLSAGAQGSPCWAWGPGKCRCWAGEVLRRLPAAPACPADNHLPRSPAR